MSKPSPQPVTHVCPGNEMGGGVNVPASVGPLLGGGMRGSGVGLGEPTPPSVTTDNDAESTSMVGCSLRRYAPGLARASQRPLGETATSTASAAPPRPTLGPG